jgi:hypothetical protein
MQNRQRLRQFSQGVESRKGAGQTACPRDSPIFFGSVRAAGRQCWVRFESASAELVALANPNPHLPGTVNVTTAWEHPQLLRLSASSGKDATSGAWTDLAVALSEDLPGRYVSFNGPWAGNSLDQFHFSVNNPPEGMGLLPIEDAINRERAKDPRAVMALNSYPAAAVVFVGKPTRVAEQIARAIESWMSTPQRTGNGMVRSVDGITTAVFWPRLST